MENSKKNDTQLTKEVIWVTYQDKYGQTKSAPLEIFLKMSKIPGMIMKQKD